MKIIILVIQQILLPCPQRPKFKIFPVGSGPHTVFWSLVSRLQQNYTSWFYLWWLSSLFSAKSFSSHWEITQALFPLIFFPNKSGKSATEVKRPRSLSSTFPDPFFLIHSWSFPFWMSGDDLSTPSWMAWLEISIRENFLLFFFVRSPGFPSVLFKRKFWTAHDFP